MNKTSKATIEQNTQSKTRTQERGATLVEYALLMALVLIGLIAGINLVSGSGADLLNASSTEIGTPRPARQVVLDAPLTPPPLWASTTIPPSILTWTDRPVATAAGCLSVVGATLQIAPCGSPGATPMHGLSDDGQLTRISVATGSACLTGDNLGPTPTVTMQACGGIGQTWRETSSAGATITLKNEASGLCLQTITPAAPEALTMAACDGTAGQTVEVQF